MTRSRYRLTPAVEEQITSYIRAGGYDWVAAEAVGIPRAVFRRWLRRGRSRGRPPYRRFYQQVLQARAQARLGAEMAAKTKDPRSWLRYGPGRETSHAPGWTTAAKPSTPAERPGRVLESAEWLGLWSMFREVLAPHPEALAAILQRLDDFEQRPRPDA